jgi:sugar-specific transcriptional regulator TrmB
MEKNVYSQLEQIGLTKGEIAVYFSLLELGSSTVGPIVDKSKLSSSKIYDVLERLIGKGLVSYVVRENKKYFEAASPNRILDYLKEKEESIRLQQKDIENIMPELLLKQKMAKKTQEVTIYEGIKGIKTAREKSLQTLKKGEEFCILGASTTFNENLSDYWLKYHKKREKAGVNLRMLCNRNIPKEDIDSRNLLKLCEAKYMPTEVITPS